MRETSNVAIPFRRPAASPSVTSNDLSPAGSTSLATLAATSSDDFAILIIRMASTHLKSLRQPTLASSGRPVFWMAPSARAVISPATTHVVAGDCYNPDQSRSDPLHIPV